MPHLLNLPVELLTYIMGMLVTSIGPSHIHTMLLVCKYFYEIALPLSVHVFRNTAPLSVGTGDCSERRNAQFLRYILIDKPELARLVKVIVIGNARSRRGSRELGTDATTVSTPKELDIYEQRTRDVLQPVSQYNEFAMLRETLIEDLRRGFSEAQLSLIMLFCRHVRTLYFEQEDPICNLPLVMTFGAHLHTLHYVDLQPAPFSNVKEVYCEPGSKKSGQIMWECAKTLMTLPRLRVYEAMLGDCSRVGGPFPRVPPRSSPVREIILNQSNVRPEMLNTLLQACTAVEKFELSKFVHDNKCASMCVCVRGGPGYQTASVFSFVSARQVLRSLLPHRDTLTHLRLIMHDQRAKSMRTDLQWVVHMGTQLREMTALQTLEVEMESLTANHKSPVPADCPKLVDCLPRSLVKLQIQNCNALTVEPALELLGAVERGDTFTQLRQIRLVFDLDSVIAKDLGLVLNSPDTTLAVLFQSRETNIFALGPAVNTPNRKMPALCSRVYAEDIRGRWLELRGAASRRDLNSRDPNRLIHPPTMSSRYRDEAVEYLV
ncbi:unnamed protein product [Clonostachys solani]|uniref:F-box domain-containing protein n=1 Tax=Clonostachys solani TaxID=160281 RepID=A0A9N9W427_9HYPO|nr:unnamed protein product [Clonostachys solani]